MRCLKCGAQIKENEEICKVCGAIINEEELGLDEWECELLQEDFEGEREGDDDKTYVKKRNMILNIVTGIIVLTILGTIIIPLLLSR